ILRTLARLAAPNVLATSTMVLVGLAETWTVGRLGVVPLAALGLVFPFAMLTGMLSAGAMGGGVSSAVARALGAGDTGRAQAVALHALVIGATGGALYSLLLLALAAPLFALLGARGEVLREALGYSTVLFAGAIAVWLFNTLASILRGTGNMRVPSAALIGAGLLQIALGIVLGLGLGGAPRLGMPGVALALIVAQSLGATLLLQHLRRGGGRLRLRVRGVPLQRALFADILRVGAVACLSPLQSVTTMVLMAGFVAQLGVLPLAGYAIGQRLEFLMSTVAFGIGLACVPMVGMAIGAGQVARARRVAWTAGASTAAVLSGVGLVVALQPDLWATIFTADERVLAHTRSFLHWAGPAFGFFGFGLTLYFAAQGAGRMTGPVIAATLRLLLVAAGGSWLVAHDAAPWQLFALGAASMVVYGTSCGIALRLDRWGAAR
ncbi:MAG: MATE family efflux transporter, partial [Burkholderiales bacterium]|nr:MATE family efflux transporter [Burkholderiales bacterium]